MPATSTTPTPARALVAWRQACADLGCRMRTPRETVPVAEAAGRVTAEPVLALRPAPAFDSAAMDGIAVRADDVAGASPRAPVLLTSRQFAVVDTGDPIPARFDTVIAREQVQPGADGEAVIAAPAQSGWHVRRVGEDVRAGEPLFLSGHRLRPVDLAVAAATGSVLLSVHQIPHVAVIPTGDELRPPGAALAPGEVVESNSPMIAGLARELGCRATVAPIVPDCPAAIAEAVRRAACSADLVVVIAGGGAGRDDYTSRVFDELGSLVVHGVAVRPGHPVCLGVVDEPRVPLLGVPGYPVAAALDFDLFAKPMLAALAGQPTPARPRVAARLAVDLESAAGVDEWVRVALARSEADLLATPLRGGAGVLSSLMRADGLLLVPYGTAALARGARVEVELLRAPTAS